MASSSDLRAVEHADAGRAVELVACRHVEIAVERAHVDRHVVGRLRPVHEDRNLFRVSHADDRVDRIDRPERVRHVRDGQQSRARSEERVEGVEQELARIVDRRHAEPGAALLAQQLPRHDVRVVLHRTDHHLVTSPDAPAAERVRHQVDAFGGVAREDDLLGRCRVEERPDLLPGGFMGLGGNLAQQVHAAMHVRIAGRVVVASASSTAFGFCVVAALSR